MEETEYMKKRRVRGECYDCRFRESVPGNAHIKCTNPDPEMVGDLHGIKNGWFIYPDLFDPVWKRKQCSNFESNKEQEAAE